ncbi:MAG: hypothetical protein EPO67_12450 [Reyranella sp.]|jgi:hypothetical protein|nr:MAG: hypothetical protein EPO67_12450 [Reyranella sp.]
MSSNELSFDEEVTLRRVAFGESPAFTLRARDLAQLRRLRLVVDGKDGPQLTADGRRRFDELPRALLRADAGPRDLLSAVVTSIAESRAKRD